MSGDGGTGAGGGGDYSSLIAAAVPILMNTMGRGGNASSASGPIAQPQQAPMSNPGSPMFSSAQGGSSLEALIREILKQKMAGNLGPGGTGFGGGSSFSGST